MVSGVTEMGSVLAGLGLLPAAAKQTKAMPEDRLRDRLVLTIASKTGHLRKLR
jgi:hypothetical protein